MQHRVVAIVPAAGLGRRFGEGRNKPFEELGGKPVMVWTLEALDRMSEIQEIIAVLKESDIEAAADLFRTYGIKKIQRIVPGGRERQDSVFNGLHFVKEKSSVVLIHDGVRPLLEQKTVRRALNALSGHDGVVIGVPLKDTVKKVVDGVIMQTLKRAELYTVQTPQIFYYQPLFEAYEKAMKDAYYATDDAALVERYGGRIAVVQGEYTNVKITTPEDLVIAEAFLKMRREKR